MSRITRTAALALAASCVAAAPAAAAPTQDFIAGAELLRSYPLTGWDINLVMGGTFGTDDGSAISPIRKMKMSFPSGARFNGDRFPVCKSGDAALDGDCPSGAKIGSGTLVALLNGGPIQSKMTAWNGPGNASTRRVFLEIRALSTVAVAVTGVMRKTSGTYGYTLDLDVPPIIPELTNGQGVAVQSFETTIGGSIRSKGKRYSLMSAPTSCKGGWKFSATFTYASGAVGTVNKQIPCKLLAS